jgi:cytochrome c-type biogenesis protein CcmH/NrfF
VTRGVGRAACAGLVVFAAFIGGAEPLAQKPPSARAETTASVAPGDTALERLTRSVAAQLRCPVCQGLSLADSPSELALEMKDVVREQLRAGRTPDDVKAYFVAKYGEWILLEPPRRGVNLLAYLLPAVAIVGGAALIWLMLGRWTRGGPETPESEWIRVRGDD